MCVFLLWTCSDDSMGYQYPFTLRVVGKDGNSCAWCPWYRWDNVIDNFIYTDTHILSHLIQVVDVKWNLEIKIVIVNIWFLSWAETVLTSGNWSMKRSRIIKLTDKPRLVMRCRAMHLCPRRPSFCIYPTVRACVSRFCRGCLIECTDDRASVGNAYIAVDWDPTALHLRYQTSQERVKTHTVFLSPRLGTYGEVEEKLDTQFTVCVFAFAFSPFVLTNFKLTTSYWLWACSSSFSRGYKQKCCWSIQA